MNMVDFANQLLRDYGKQQILVAMETMKNKEATAATATPPNPR